MFRRPLATLLLTLIAAGSLAPAVAFAQTPFAPLPQPQNTETEATTSGATDPNDGGLERWQEILIFAGGIALVVGIGWAILSDARGVAPVSDTRELYEDPLEKERGTRTPAEQRKRTSRKKGKAQRQARKQNR